MKTILSTLCIVVQIVSICNGETSGIQKLILYNHANYSGDSQVYYENELDIQGNSEVGKDAQSHCVPHGFWTARLQLTRSSPPMNTTVRMWANGNLGSYCFSFQSDNYTTKYITVGRSGALNTSHSAISLYSDYMFMEDELYFDGTQLSLPFDLWVSSLVFSGEGDWATFSEANYKGEENCVPTYYFEGHLVGITTSRHTNPIKVRSIRLGCSKESKKAAETQMASQRRKSENQAYYVPEGVTVNMMKE